MPLGGRQARRTPEVVHAPHRARHPEAVVVQDGKTVVGEAWRAAHPDLPGGPAAAEPDHEFVGE